MICPRCKSEGNIHKVYRKKVKFMYDFGYFYVDEEGVKQYYDTNACVILYACSNEHNWKGFSYSP